MQAGEGADVTRISLPNDEADDRKRAKHREEIAHEVIKTSRAAGARVGLESMARGSSHCGHTQQQITRMCDARITEQAFDVALGDGAKVAIENSDPGND